MGSGKTTVGNRLAAVTGWPYYDNDELLRAIAPASARELAIDGPARLRRAEADALSLGMDMPPPAILSAAAGVILDRECVKTLRRADIVAWLHADATTLAARTLEGKHRPWLDRDPVGWLSLASRRRRLLYSRAASIEVRTDQLPIDECAELILGAVLASRCSRAQRRPI
jgi:shikimate kinase